MRFKSEVLAASVGLGLALACMPAYAGPFIISGTDSEDHGSATTVNLGGWLYMQKAIENVAAGVTNGNKNLVVLGSSGGTAGSANASAFGLSSISGTWTQTTIDGVADLTTYFGGGTVSGVNLANTGIMMIDSGANTIGGITVLEDGVLTANAAAINTYVGGGGGLFSQASLMGWLSALIPGIIITDVGGGGFSDPLALTAAGTAAFPGLTNADISTGPWHHHFANYAPVNLLAQSTTAGSFDVILGAAGGSITNPDPIPEPASLALLLAGLVGMAAIRRRGKA